MARLRPCVALGLMLLAALGCEQQGLDITPAEATKTLSNLLLVPEKSCEDLQRDFGLEYLPLAENPADIGIPYEAHWVRASNGAAVRLWYMPAQLQRGVIIISNGASGDARCYLFAARLFLNNGWTVVMYDYEGFGLSSGQPDLEALHVDLDAVLTWTLVRTNQPQASLFGISIGTLPSVSVAVERPNDVNAVILDSPVALGEELRRFNALLAGQASFVRDQLDPRIITEEYVRQLTVPVMVLLHESDTVTPPDSVELIYDRAGGERELVRFPDLQHARGQYFDTDLFLYHADRFLWKAWTPLASSELIELGFGG